MQLVSSVDSSSKAPGNETYQQCDVEKGTGCDEVPAIRMLGQWSMFCPFVVTRDAPTIHPVLARRHLQLRRVNDYDFDSQELAISLKGDGKFTFHYSPKDKDSEHDWSWIRRCSNVGIGDASNAIFRLNSPSPTSLTPEHAGASAIAPDSRALIKG